MVLLFYFLVEAFSGVLAFSAFVDPSRPSPHRPNNERARQLSTSTVTFKVATGALERCSFFFCYQDDWRAAGRNGNGMSDGFLGPG